MATKAAIRCPVVVRVAISWVTPRSVPTTAAVIVRTDRDSRPDKRYRQNGSSRSFLLLDDLRTLIESHASAAQFFRQILLKCRVCAF